MIVWRLGILKWLGKRIAQSASTWRSKTINRFVRQDQRFARTLSLETVSIIIVALHIILMGGAGSLSVNKRERKVMQSRGLIPTPGSGSKSGWKGDGQDETWVVEYKLTFSKQFILKQHMWEKVEREALRAHKRPRMEIEMPDCYLVVMCKEDFCELIEEGR